MTRETAKAAAEQTWRNWAARLTQDTFEERYGEDAET